MKTKDKVIKWIIKYPTLRDDDNRLCCNIWAEEMSALGLGDIDVPYIKFLELYSANKLTSAPSIKRARAKLQEEEPKYRGEKYNLRKGILQDKWRKDLGYEENN
jgi:hypothetical protein